MKEKVIYFKPEAILDLKSSTSIHLLLYLASIADTTGLSNFITERRLKFLELTGVKPITVSRSLKELISKGFIKKYSTNVYIVNPNIAYNITVKPYLEQVSALWDKN